MLTSSTSTVELLPPPPLLLLLLLLLDTTALLCIIASRLVAPLFLEVSGDSDGRQLEFRRMTNICERWSKDHTNALQYALLNGDGCESWANVRGSNVAVWNGIQNEMDLFSATSAAGVSCSLRTGFLIRSPLSQQRSSSLVCGPLPTANSSAAWTVVNRDVKSLSTGPAIYIINHNPPPGDRWRLPTAALRYH
jgi:hypothetical protein